LGDFLPWGFPVPTASSMLGVHFPRFASPGTFRLQVFSTSWRFTPPNTLRVSFTPLTLLGFHPSERSPRDEPSALPVTRCPLDIAFLTNRSPRNSRFAGVVDFDLGSSSMNLSAAFRALLPYTSSLQATRCYPTWSLDALLGFALSRVFPTSAMARPSPCLLSCACPSEPPRLPWVAQPAALQSIALPR